MKKIVNKIKQNAKIITAFVLGAILTGGTVYAATVLPSSQVGYDNSTSGLAATDVQGALDELNIKANTWINPLGDYQMNPNKNIIASSSGIKLVRNGHVYEIKANNFNVEKDHIQQIFSDISCIVKEDVYSYCYADDFMVIVESNGNVTARDLSDNLYCNVNPDGSFNCDDGLAENYIEKSMFGGIETNSVKTVLATPGGITFIRNNTVYSIAYNNSSVEKDHIQQIFSDISCVDGSLARSCDASDFKVAVYTNGRVDVTDKSDNKRCTVENNNNGGISVSCVKWS